MAEEFSIGVVVDDSNALKKLNDIDDKIDDIGDTTNDTNKKIKDGFKKSDKQLKKTDKVVDSLNKSFSKTGDLIKNITSKATLTGIAGLAAGVAAVSVAMGKLTESASGLVAMSNNTGIATDALQKYSYAALKAGGNIDNLTDAIQDFTEKQGEALVDTESSWAKAFKAINVNLTGDTQKAMEDTLKMLGKMVDEGKRAEAFFAGVDLFGDAYKFTYAKAVSKGSAGVNSMLEGKGFNLRDEKALAIFANFKKSMDELVYQLLPHMDGILAPLANAAINMAKNISNIASNTSPKTLAEMNELYLDGISLLVDKWNKKVAKGLNEVSKKAHDMNKSLLKAMMFVGIQVGSVLGSLQKYLPGIAGYIAVEKVVSSTKSLYDSFGSKNPVTRARGREELIQKEMATYLALLGKSVKDREYAEEKILKLKKEQLTSSSPRAMAIEKTIVELEKSIRSNKAFEKAYEASIGALSDKKPIADAIKEFSFEAKMVGGGFEKGMNGFLKRMNKIEDRMEESKKTGEGITPLTSGALAELGEGIGVLLIQALLSGAKSKAAKNNNANGVSFEARAADYDKAVKLQKQVGTLDTLFKTVNGITIAKSAMGMYEELEKILDSTGLLDLDLTISDETEQKMKDLFDINTLTDNSIPFSGANTSKYKGGGATVLGKSFGTEFLDAVHTEIGDNFIPKGGVFFSKLSSSLSEWVDFGSEMLTGTMNIVSEISNIKTNALESDLEKKRKAQDEELNGLIVTERRKQQIQKGFDKENERTEKEIAERRKRSQISNIWSSTATGIAGLWGNAFAMPGTPPPAALAMAIGMTPLLTGLAIAQTANIAKYEKGGIVPGASTTGDRVNARVNSREMILTQRQQSRLFKIANGSINGVGGGIVQLNIENLTADDDGLQALEDKLYELQSNGRFQFAQG